VQAADLRMARQHTRPDRNPGRGWEPVRHGYLEDRGQQQKQRRGHTKQGEPIGPRPAPRPGPDQPDPHHQRIADQVRRLEQSRPPLAPLRTGHQHSQHLVLLLVPEHRRIPGQQPPVPALQGRFAHVVPPARFSRDSAAVALACSRPASTASRPEPLGVSR